MHLRFLPLFVLFLAMSLFAQTADKSASGYDPNQLARHISAAETFQISGDLPNAEIENKAIVGLALEELGNFQIEKGETATAAETLQKSLAFRESATTRISIAVAEMQRGNFDEAIIHANAAVNRDADSAYFRYVLGNVYFNKGEFEKAVPHLEKSFVIRPDFDVARALGLTYLHLKQLSRARLLYEEIETALKKPNAQLQILFGQSYEMTGYHLEAEEAFRRAISIDPNQLKASFYLGFVILKHGGSERIGEARKAFEKELTLTPEDFYSNFFAGVAALSENDIPGSIPLLKKAVALRETSEEAHLFLGQAYLETDQIKLAEAHLEKSIELDQKRKERGAQARRAHFMLSRVYLKTNRREEAREQLELARKLQLKELNDAREEISRILGQVSEGSVELTTLDKVELSEERLKLLDSRSEYLSGVLAQAFHNLGVIAFQRQRADDASAYFEQALVWNPELPGLRRNVGIISFRNANYERSAKMLGPHISNNPNDALGRRMLGVSHYILGNFGECVSALKPFGDELYKDAELAYFYGIALVQEKDFESSRAVFEKMSTDFANDPEKLFFVGQGFMFLGDFQRAIKEFDNVLANSPQFSKVNYFKGQSLIRLAKHGEAEEAFRKELAINPLDELSKYHLAITLIERRIRIDEAVGLLKDAIRYKSDYVDARYQLGKIYIDRNQINDAISQLEAAVLLDPKKDYVHYQLSIAYRKASRDEDAKKHLKLYQEIKAENRKNSAPQPMGIQ